MDPTVVVIDSNNVTCKILKAALTREGYQVETFQDPVVALQAVYRDKQIPVPNCWIMELSLPNLHGNDVIRYIRVRQKGVVPIIVFTRQNGILDRMRASLAGATTYMTKPFEREKFLTLLESLVSR